MTRTRTAAALVLLAALAGCSADTEPAAAPSPAATSTAPSPTVDPYEAYLKIAPAGAPKLSREDAQTRALLGCGQKWAPGTVDAALAKAYADLCRGR